MLACHASIHVHFEPDTLGVAESGRELRCDPQCRQHFQKEEKLLETSRSEDSSNFRADDADHSGVKNPVWGVDA